MIYKYKNIALIGLMILLIGCNKNEIKEPLAPKTNTSLKFFGFTLIDVGWDDPSDKEPKTNYIDEVSSFTNLADILVVEPTDLIIDRVNLMNQQNVKSMLHLNEIFFEEKSKGGSKSGVVFGLRNDYQQRWDDFINTNDLINNSNKIGCFYIGEEPAWNSIPESEFKQACDYVKQSIPLVPIMNIEAFFVANEIYAPSSVDWIGFDHYFLKQPSKDKDFMSEYSAVKSKLSGNQKIILIMDSHWIKTFHGSVGISKNDMDFIARDYYNMANADTNIAGILGYFWPSGFDAKNSIGARNLPQHVKDEYVKIGKTITGK